MMSELNLIPYEVKIKRAKKLKNINYISFAIIIFAILFVIIYVPTLYLDKLDSDEQKLQTKINSESKVVSENAKLLLEINNYNSFNKVVDALTKQKKNAATAIKSLEQFTPNDIILTNITYSKDQTILTGSTLNYNSIPAFTANLQMSKEYPNSLIANISNSVVTDSNKTSKIIFTINIENKNEENIIK